ncbi:MAG: M14 family metallopeptidase [Sphaerobacter sp.]|nr:M14 family metallopeptidase [Sphaerobacter sp.]
MATFKVGTAAAEPGTRADGVIPVTRRPGGEPLTIPVVVVHGTGDGPTLWIDGAIHGDEPEGPLSIQKLLAELDPRQLRGTVVAIPVVNVAAFEAQQRGNPFDGFTYDMNRIYPGRPDGYPTERVAWAHYEAMIDTADLLIAVHSGGAHSYLAQAQFYNGTDAGLELAKAMGPGWDLILKPLGSKGSPPAAMAERGKPAITVELGGLCSTLPNDFHRNGTVLKDAFLNVMRHYGMIDGEAQYADAWHLGVQRTVLAGVGGFFVPEEGVQYRTPITGGTRIARILDLYGNVLKEIVAPCDGQIFGMRTLPAVYQGDWACFFGEIHETIGR